MELEGVTLSEEIRKDYQNVEINDDNRTKAIEQDYKITVPKYFQIL